ncbi:histidine kinase [Streptomyces sp. RS10V-4]|uniref:sensor histidine kinase n=1 Tax=Streptomyces rhizoryzae TaxID=2932493 RepID=UPI0020064175|nr:histidine kinase [Streptomyces rhizoryzae]MCK7624206.1 histidine kinase [Streptomyces rhizoryzae]
MPVNVTAPAPVRRSPRDWTVDTVFFLLAVAYGVFSAKSRGRAGFDLGGLDWFHVEQIAAVGGCVLLWLRRRRPVAVALALIALSVPFEMASGAMLVALFSVAVHRPPRTTAAVYAVSLVTVVSDAVVRPAAVLPDWLFYFLFGALAQGTAVGWGLFVRHRRQLLERVAAEAELRAERAQLRAREEVAREMHDVLGHRLSLLSLHAGALEYRPDAPSEDIARAAGVIRESAHQALQDLREVLTVLRAPAAGLPQPTLADLHRLVAESCAAGMRVRLATEIPEAVPELAGRTVYRVVQEALTNVRKHAEGAPVDVRVTGEEGAGLRVEVANGPAPRHRPGPAAAPAAPPGQGLAGLAERVALAGGRLSHGPGGDGGWEVTAELPWPAAERPRT